MKKQKTSKIINVRPYLEAGNVHDVIQAATDGTIYYHYTLDQIVSYFKYNVRQNMENLILYGAFKVYGLNAIDIDNNLFGSYIDGDDLYICVSNYKDIYIQEIDQYINPEDGAYTYGIHALQDYIVDGTDEIINQYLTKYEVSNYNIDIVARYLMLKEGYKFSEVLDSYLSI